MSPLRLNGATSGYCQLDVPAVSGTSLLTVPAANGTLDRLERAGNILQVVNATYSTTVTSSSATYSDTGLTASITPSSASNKILVIVNQVGLLKITNDTGVGLRLLRDSTAVIVFEDGAAQTNSTTRSSVAAGVTYLDSPNTTSAVTYKTQFRSSNGLAAVYVQNGLVISPSSTITLLEVAA